MIVEILKKLDDKLMKERDKKIYRNKGFRNTTIKTILGDIEYKRRIYEYNTEHEKKKPKYCLRKWMEHGSIYKGVSK